MMAGIAASALAPRSVSADAAAVTRREALAAAVLRKDGLASDAARIGILFGTATDSDELQNDPSNAAAIAAECSIIVPSRFLKARYTRAKPDAFDFSKVEPLMAFAANNRLAVRGHTLIWTDLPAWLKSADLTQQQATNELLLEVSEPCRHFRGRMDSWDVVNEPINVWDKQPGGFTNTLWYRLIGPDYIAMAFTAARQADPSAVLVLNENGIEFDTPASEAKRQALLELLGNLKKSKVPVDALGIESHLGDAVKYPFNPAVFDRFLSAVHQLGLKILVSELDFTDKFLPGDVDTRDQAMAQTFGTYLTTVLRHPGVITVTVWGLSDRHTWLATYAARADGMPVRACLLDSNLARKPAYSAVRAAFDAAPQRPA
jgi:endo-1,4-beta-xylanase